MGGRKEREEKGEGTGIKEDEGGPREQAGGREEGGMEKKRGRKGEEGKQKEKGRKGR